MLRRGDIKSVGVLQALQYHACAVLSPTDVSQAWRHIRHTSMAILEQPARILKTKKPLSIQGLCDYYSQRLRTAAQKCSVQ